MLQLRIQSQIKTQIIKESCQNTFPKSSINTNVSFPFCEEWLSYLYLMGCYKVWDSLCWKIRTPLVELPYASTAFWPLSYSQQGFYYFHLVWWEQKCYWKGGPFPGPELSSCLTLRNELSEETHVLTKQKTLLGRGTRAESSRVREPRRTALPCGSQS